MQVHAIAMDLEERLQHPTRTTTTGKHTTLYLGELALGTRAHNPQLIKGLARFLRANALDEQIGHVVINGGLLPYIPTFYGVQNAREMIFLGNIQNHVSDRTRVDLSKLNARDRQFMERWVEGKITNMPQAVQHAQSVMEPLTQTLDDAVWHYLQGEEDTKNTQALVELKINDSIRLALAEQEDQERYNSLAFELSTLQEELSDRERQYELLRHARNNIHHTKKKPQVQHYLNQYITEHTESLEYLEDPGAFLRTLQGAASRSDLTSKLKKLDAAIKANRKTVRQKQREQENVAHDLDARARVREASQFFRITKRQHIKSDQAELFRYEAKREYNDQLYEIFPELSFHVHSGNEVTLYLDGVQVDLAHKPSISSNTPGKADVRRTKKKNKSLGRNGFTVGDLSVTAHGAGGFRMEVQPKRPETIERGVERETPEINMVLQLPTLQSVAALREATQKGIKNVHTQRYEKGNFSSGAILYTVHDNGEHDVAMITGDELLRYAEQNLESRIRAEERITPVKGAVFTDLHFGCPNYPGRPSNYELFESAKRSLYAEGLPDLLVINGDILHGCLERHFGSNEQYYADGPADIEQRIEALSTHPEQAQALREIATRELSHSIPLTNVSKQLREVKRRLVPIMHDVLNEGGYVFITSGNHYNETSKYLDEATDIANLLDLEHLDHPRLVPFTSYGDKYAMGQKTLDNGLVIYCSHGPTRGSDNVVGALQQVHGSYKHANLAIYGHVHHAGGGHAEGTFALIGAAMQPWNPYIDRVGLEPGQRGIVLFELDDHGKEYCRWRFLLDQALEGQCDT